MGHKPGRPVKAMQRSQPAQPEAGGWDTYRPAGGRARQAEKQTGRWSGSHEGWGDRPPEPKAHPPGPPGVDLSLFGTFQGKAATPTTQPSLAACIPLGEGNSLGSTMCPCA